MAAIPLKRLERVYFFFNRMKNRFQDEREQITHAKSKQYCKQSTPSREIHKYRVPFLFPMELLLLEEKRGKLRFENSQRKALVALSWPERDERRMVKSEASHHEKCDHCDLNLRFVFKKV